MPEGANVNFVSDEEGRWAIRTFERWTVPITALIMLSARPSRIRAQIANDGRVERSKLVDDLNTMIMEEVERQQGAGE